MGLGTCEGRKGAGSLWETSKEVGSQNMCSATDLESFQMVM